MNIRRRTILGHGQSVGHDRERSSETRWRSIFRHWCRLPLLSRYGVRSSTEHVSSWIGVCAAVEILVYTLPSPHRLMNQWASPFDLSEQSWRGFAAISVAPNALQSCISASNAHQTTTYAGTWASNLANLGKRRIT